VAVGLNYGLGPGQFLMADSSYSYNAIRERDAELPGKTAEEGASSLRPRPLQVAQHHRTLLRKADAMQWLATRYDKHANSFMAGIIQAAIRVTIKANESKF
jgi:hypothetical protein